MAEDNKTTRGPYEVLSDYAARFWQIYQDNLKTNKKIAKRALNHYDVLEDNYLEPARRKKIRENTQKYRGLTKTLKASTDRLEKAIKDIDATIKKAEKLKVALKYLETAIKIGAKFLA